MKIERITTENSSDINTSNDSFDIIGRLEIYFDDVKWDYSEIIFPKAVEKCYPDYDGAVAEDYIDADNRAAYLAYEDDRCVGQILLSRSWNRYAHIEDLSVARAYRGKGIGESLLNVADAWAKKKSLTGLSVECQDNNIPASRFLSKNGFEIGGVNTRLYAMLGEPYNSETAVFWYKNI